MNYTEKQIDTIALQVMKDIDWPYNIKKGPSSFETTIEEQYEKYKKLMDLRKINTKYLLFG
ncbi:hypothetical protein [Flavobacterium lindanitolerans]|uniref:Uncharacterized protein n=1 Tax=Flavobacterium lindanitolerans TaxID=428988 RepID=A0A497UPW2_9FLAO|nr:hypothetical protein [Flavobacterium lindanitolerans]MBC8644521.1 hypothetical protein [Flavobacterium lindanitolerans]PKW20876.1 hypothetical protein B0G92_2155 [Flavobacterium lindanitolerans]RLJ30485.1 hypothetical protein CLV50_1895 [Flavobacterium lindanitolerans]